MPLKQLKPEEKVSTETLIATIERKDRRFRLFQTLFMVATFLALSIIIGAQQRLLGEIKQQAAEQSQRSDDRQDKIVRRLNCMVIFFSTPNRQNLSIENIDQCSLNRNGNVQQFFEQPENTPAEQPPNLNGSAPTATQENAEAQAPPAKEKPTKPTSPPATVEPRPPVEVLGIPLCIPFTGVCLHE